MFEFFEFIKCSFLVEGLAWNSTQLSCEGSLWPRSFKSWRRGECCSNLLGWILPICCRLLQWLLLSWCELCAGNRTKLWEPSSAAFYTGKEILWLLSNCLWLSCCISCSTDWSHLLCILNPIDSQLQPSIFYLVGIISVGCPELLDFLWCFLIWQHNRLNQKLLLHGEDSSLCSWQYFVHLKLDGLCLGRLKNSLARIDLEQIGSCGFDLGW